MDLLDLISKKWTSLDVINLFLMAFSMIQLFECLNTFLAQRKFFKHNSTTEKIKERTSKVLLGFVLNLIDTRLGKVAFQIVSGVFGVIVYAILLLATPNLVHQISSVISIIAFGSWIVISKRNNRIVKRIEEAKPNIPR